jgi:Uncharacterised nucleotidyltransferase
MNAQGLHPNLRAEAVKCLLIDRLTAEIADAFETRGIAMLVLKGPVIARWFYPGEVRPYIDSDVMVAPGDWERAVATLQGLGFSDPLSPMAHPRMESFASTPFLRGEEIVDLHCALHGLGGDLELVWESLSADCEHQLIGGTELRVPGRAALLLHIGLHVAHHRTGKTLEDLRRAIAYTEEDLWREALKLARAHEGVPTFASGLRLLPEGVDLSRRLGIEDVRSTAHEIGYEEVPTAEAIHALLSPRMGTRRRLSTVARELFPRPEFMRWWSPLARRGDLGMIASYPWRWLWLLVHAPRGVLAVRRARRYRAR